MTEDKVEIVPPKNLKKKVGSGGIPLSKIYDAEKAKEVHSLRYPSIAKSDIEIIKDIISSFQKTRELSKQEFHQLEDAVIHLKSNAAMFDYPIVSHMATSLLNFIATIPQFRNETLDVIIAHQQAIEAILLDKQSGDTGAHGQMLMKELSLVVKRYYTSFL